MVVKWPTIPIIDQGPISRLCPTSFPGYSLHFEKVERGPWERGWALPIIGTQLWQPERIFNAKGSESVRANCKGQERGNENGKSPKSPKFSLCARTKLN